MKHTPGPWAKVLSTKSHPKQADAWHIYHQPSGSMFTTVCFVESKANAKLIAAAPELLEACDNTSSLLDQLINQTPTGQLRNYLCDLNIEIKAAIKKATS